MKIQAIFEGDGAKLVLTPETQHEKVLLGATLSSRSRASVTVNYDGYTGNGNASLVSIVLGPGAIKEDHEH